MKNIIYNLLILGALFISTQYKGQHLLEALDAPIDRILIGGGGDVDDDIQANKCRQQGFYWEEGISGSPLARSRGCYCPSDNRYIGGPAQWTLNNGSGQWICAPRIGGEPIKPDPDQCIDDCDHVKPPGQ